MFARVNLKYMEHKVIIRNLNDIDRAASQFLDEIAGNRIIAFYAPMGAGKTTFTTAVCRQLGVRDDAVSSPTFSIVNEYRAADGSSIYHFDFYRISKIEEAFDIGIYDYLDSGSLCLIEWPENIGEILPDDALKVHIMVMPDESREIVWDAQSDD